MNLLDSSDYALRQLQRDMENARRRRLRWVIFGYSAAFLLLLIYFLYRYHENQN